MKKKSKLGPITVSRTFKGKSLYPKGPYASVADAFLGPNRGNLSRIIPGRWKAPAKPAKEKEAPLPPLPNLRNAFWVTGKGGTARSKPKE